MWFQSHTGYKELKILIIFIPFQGLDKFKHTHFYFKHEKHYMKQSYMQVHISKECIHTLDIARWSNIEYLILRKKLKYI